MNRKMYRKKGLRSLCLLLVLMLTVQLVVAESAREIIEQMEKQMRGASSYVEMQMKTVRPRYTREVSMKSWSKGEEYSLIVITAPARDKGTAFLKRDKEMWNYVPNIDRTIKMPPSMMSQSWMGSDFSNDDLIRESSTIDDYTHRILKEESCQGYDCWVLELIPDPESSIVYGKVLIWVSKEDYLQLKIENYDEDDFLVSTIQFKEVEKMGGRKIPTVMEMMPADKMDHKTILHYEEARFNIDLENDFFSIQNLKNIK